MFWVRQITAVDIGPLNCNAFRDNLDHDAFQLSLTDLKALGLSVLVNAGSNSA